MRLWIIVAALSVIAVSEARTAYASSSSVSRASFERSDSSFRPSGLPIVTFAGGTLVESEPAAPAGSVWLKVSSALSDFVATAILAALGFLIAFLRSRSSESKAANIGLVITEAARAAVLELDASLKPTLKAYLADGILSDEEKADLKARAMLILTTKLPPGILKTAGEVFGAAFVTTYLSGKIEQAVAEKNAMQAAGEKLAPGAKISELVAVPPAP